GRAMRRAFAAVSRLPICRRLRDALGRKPSACRAPAGRCLAQAAAGIRRRGGRARPQRTALAAHGPNGDVFAAETRTRATKKLRAGAPSEPATVITYVQGLELAFGLAFVALHGSWNRARRTGYKLVRVPLHDGAPSGTYEIS